jgi:hypothetical protein
MNQVYVILKERILIKMKKEELRKLYSILYTEEYMMNVDIKLMVNELTNNDSESFNTTLVDGTIVRVLPSGMLFLNKETDNAVQITLGSTLPSIVKNSTKEDLETLSNHFFLLADKLENVDDVSSISARLVSSRLNYIIKTLY